MSDSGNTAQATSAPEKSRSTAEADITKYKDAADIVNVAVKKLVGLFVEGANVLDLCVEGDKLIEEGTSAVYNKSVKGVKVSKGLAFPTCISVNNCVAHFSPLACVFFLPNIFHPSPARNRVVLTNKLAPPEPPFSVLSPTIPSPSLPWQSHARSSDPLSAQKLAKGDVVKVHLGAHIDGFAAISAETIVVGATLASPVTGRRADALRAAWTAAEVAMRLVRVGNKNWQVTEAVSKVAAAWDCKPVEGMLSCQQTQNVIDGKKRIILNPSEGQKKDFETITFAEGEVYGIDVLVSSTEDGKARLEETRTTIYQRDHNVSYQLKMKTSRAVFSEVQKKAGPFPFNVRVLEDEKRARMGLQEAVQHSLVKPYDVVYTPQNTFVAAFHFTIALLAGGPSLLTHPPVWYRPELVKTERELEDETFKELLTKKLRETKKQKKKAAAGEGEAEGK
ncbi:proliferation-associated protein 1 [Russula ochroleuca]|uniref:Proliferation-associated protein 1 n=1 Tax=Russula ochroleuca TaxID=152965 RepID=A0A9P5TDS7_9AGAM|nr:proliferation-associated protein 1 [Russula ochroleuca]